MMAISTVRTPQGLVRFPNWLDRTTRSSGWGTWLDKDPLRVREGPQRTPGGLPENLQSSSTAFLTKTKSTTANSLICWSFVFQQPKSIITIIIMILRVIFKRYHRSWNCCRTFFVIINLCIAHIRSKITFYLILFQFSWFLTLVSTELVTATSSIG